jgi:DtxR family transcriptional regulator, Mn-dependent transcriptional regulator
MVNPAVALVLGVVGLFLLAFTFWPQKGILASIKRLRRQSLRIQIEDALKHLYDCEYRGVGTSLESLAGALSLTRDDAVTLVDRLMQLKLVASDGAALVLTSDGRSYALRVIRIHRLWERYLSEETAVRETEWHTQAEKVEHVMTLQEAEQLAQKLGHPVLDPHGDPIPTATGTIPPMRGVALNRMNPGAHAVIVHIEDEPAAIYNQLVAQGLHIGMHVRVSERAPDRLVIESEGNELGLAPLSAANISVIPVESKTKEAAPHRTLSSLPPGREAVVRGVSPACRGLQRRRLLDLGVVPGTVIRAEMVSPTGDPTAYRIRGATIALRRKQADLIYVDDPKEARP